MIKAHTYSLQSATSGSPKGPGLGKTLLAMAGAVIVWALILVLMMFSTGCGSQLRGKGGQHVATLGNDSTPMAMTLQQPENPKANSKQEASEKTTEHNSYPPGTVISNVEPIVATAKNGTPLVLGSKTNVIVVGGDPSKSAESATQSKTVEKDVWASIGAAYEDSVGRILATMKSLRWLQIVGVVLVLFGLASLFWPYLRLIVNSTPTSIAVTTFGGALIFGPPLVALHPWASLGVAVGVCLFIWLAHNHFNLKAALAEAEGAVDKVIPTKTPEAAPAVIPVVVAPAAPAPATQPSAQA